jgi:thiamine pyrophosphate-dependent acetolactate synthase large subunit-like protein
MRELLQQFLDHEISRRDFGLGLSALGLSAAAVEAVLADAGGSADPMPRDGVKVSGTGAQILLETFIAADLKFLFGTTATGMSPLFDAMTLKGDVEWVMSVAESQATAMAHGYELASGGTAAVFVPGVAIPSTMTMLYNAWKDRSSLVVFSDAPANTIPFRNMFQQMEDWVEPMIQFTKARWQIDNADHISELSRRAFKVAGTPPGGPVHVRIPSNVLGARNLTQRVYPQSRFTVAVEMRPKPELVEQTARALLEAKAPMITAGPEVTRAGATPALVELAELLGIPVAQGYSVYGDFPWRNPLWAGFHGLGIPTSIAGADVFMNLGGAMPGPGIFTAPPPKSALVIDARVEYEAIGMTYPSDIAIAAGMRETVEDLADAVRGMATAERLRAISEPRLEQARAAQAKATEQRKENAKAQWDASPMSWPRISAELDLALDDDAIIVPELDYRTPFYWMDFDLGKKTVIGQTTGFALGWGIAAAQGVKIAEPDRQVACLVGDGAVLFGEIEALWSAARYDIPIIIVVFNNRSYDNERNRLQQLSPLYSRTGTRELWRDICGWLGDPNVDFVGLAKSFEIDGMRAETPSQFRKAMKRAVAATREGRPYLVDAMIMQIDRRGRPTDESWYPELSFAERRKRQV